MAEVTMKDSDRNYWSVQYMLIYQENQFLSSFSIDVDTRMNRVLELPGGLFLIPFFLSLLIVFRNFSKIVKV